MWVAVTSAKGQLTELIRRAEAGEEVVLTRHGRAVVCLVPVDAPVAPKPAESCSRRREHPGPPRRGPGKVRQEARTSFMAQAACPSDCG